ncbi:MAG: DUF58 domain-containing protein [bacterium]|nr:DUF58 domain-containing protein [bacterium]
MRLTRFGFKGVLFYATLVTAFFASPYSNLFFLLLGFLTLQWMLCVLWTRANMRGVRASIPDIEPMPAGAGGVVHARVETTGTRFQVQVELQTDAGAQAGQAEVVRGEASVAIRIPPLPRGLHSLASARVTSSYPLGLLAVHRPVSAPPELVVYPTPIELASARSSSEALADVIGDSATGAGDLQPSGLRDHHEGDEVRAIHWRATARRGSLVVKEFEGGGGDGLELVLDRRCGAEELEEALSIVTAIVQLARSNKEVLVLHSQDLSATFGAGHRPWNEVLHFLAGADALPQTGPAPPPVSPSVTRLPLAAAHAR